jgi:asparagine synthase (glutamine-hydrolysing)
MCGISGLIHLNHQTVNHLHERLDTMNDLLIHRGPDGEGIWMMDKQQGGLAHRRLSIIDLRTAASQPMRAKDGTVVVLNGEIYNYLELKKELGQSWEFQTLSDTESILATYARYGEDHFLDHLRGMFSLALWDPKTQKLICARDRFGIKPFYYTIQDSILYFASEAKALLPFLETIETDPSALAEYITFQYTLGEHTLFKGIKQLLPGHMLVVDKDGFQIKRYWDVKYNIDYNHSPKYFEEKLTHLLEDSIKVHLRSDVPVASYLSGGVDSSLIALLGSHHHGHIHSLFHGKFTSYPGYDESHYAESIAERMGAPLYQIDIQSQDFKDNIEKVIYHLDFPVAGPGSFPQYMVSKLASEQVKVILGGQGGDEIFGGYARYVIAYFEQCIKASINGTHTNGNFVVTAESIIPNLSVLKEYTPLIKEFWREGLFGELDDRYFRLSDRSTDMTDEIDWTALNKDIVLSNFKAIFNNERNVGKEAYFDKMTHFDFKSLLPALLHVEDRMSMAHSIESRVPFLDHPLVEFVATVPADIKFQGGRMKLLLKETFKHLIPDSILNRRDKMGFPVPLKEWFEGDLKGFLKDIFHSGAERPFLRKDVILKNIGQTSQFSRKIWGLMNLEIWHQLYHDRHAEFKKRFTDKINKR